MKKIFQIPMLLFVLAVSILSCKKDETKMELQEGSFPASAFRVSASNIVLDKATENDTALRFNWAAAAFGPQPVISYTLQLDVPADTAAPNNWSHAKIYPLGSKINAFGFVTKELNSVLNGMGLNYGVVNDIVFRIKAEVNQQNGATSTVKPVYSNTMLVKITSYGLNMYIPGDYQGWSPGTAPILAPVKGKVGIYDAYINITGPGIQYFKFTTEPDWNHTNYGDGGNNTFTTDGNAGGLHADDGPGYYEVSGNFNNNTWKATKTTWGIVGDATPGGWDNDTPMTYDAAAQVWKVTVNMLHNGSFKFRANGNWGINFGIDANGKIVYADNPFVGNTAGLNNLTVPEDGNYTITLDLHTSGAYTFNLHKN